MEQKLPAREGKSSRQGKEAPDASQCVHCGLCAKNCSFLTKHGIDIGDTGKLRELAYHCFLCGKCSEVCPVGIDGRGVVLKMRQDRARQAGKLEEEGYGLLLAEKKNYLFRNYRHKKGKSAFFPGCNFPSFYPNTTKKLMFMLEQHGIGTVFDCCGKPVAELGLQKQEREIVGKVRERLGKAGVEEVIMACPNCHSFLKPQLGDIRVTSIYEKLAELGIGKKIKKDISVFLPCPDRKEKMLLRRIEPFIQGNIQIIAEASCCGLGGCAAAKEPELSKGMAQSLIEAGYEPIYTYCGSCAGNLSRNGCGKVTHMLAEILETGESPDISNSMVNRMKSKFW